MSVLGLTVRPWQSPFAAELSTARGAISGRKGLLIEVRDASGERGVGEASPLEGFSTEHVGEVAEALQGVEASRLALEDPAGAVAGLGLPPAAAHGLEQALWDLLGRQQGRPVCALLGGIGECEVPISRLVRTAGDALESMRQGVETVKLKVGVGSLDKEVALLGSIRKAVGPGMQIRLDANGAWSFEEALVALERLGRWEPELVEQPLAVGAPVDQWAALRRIGVPIAADESVRNEASMMALMAGLDAVVLKPMFIGGLQDSVHMGRKAIAEGRLVVVTSCLGSGVERYGALHVAAALRGPALLSCGLDTGGFLQDDPCPGPFVSGGSMRVTGSGMGIPEERR